MVSKVSPKVKKRICMGCDRDISHKHPNAKFCTKPCKYRYHNADKPRGTIPLLHEG